MSLALKILTKRKWTRDQKERGKVQENGTVQTMSSLLKKVKRRKLKKKRKKKKDLHCPRPARKIFHWLQGKKKLQRKLPRENLLNHLTLKNPMMSHLMMVRRKPRQKVNQKPRRMILNLKKSPRNLKMSRHLPRKCLWASPRMQLSLTYPTRVKRKRRKKKRMMRMRRLEFNQKLLFNHHQYPG